MITVQYTEQELQALTQLLDVATKAGGLSVAGASFALHQKHDNAFRTYQHMQEAEALPSKPPRDMANETE